MQESAGGGVACGQREPGPTVVYGQRVLKTVGGLRVNRARKRGVQWLVPYGLGCALLGERGALLAEVLR
ncbi:hypothetical protein NDU88_004516 [Pleurodeles waltl]|uniref:Uncharacterized protein n=1 Tax=Pleurodeles waltl TaxID=8319 RepID=A0AAV7RJH7_PLEWA|nr:hypothetical protein NDU88_004516 [Pleurodeles waltl]